MTFEEGVGAITQHFRIALSLAEQMFGKRDDSWTFVGVEFKEDGPYIMYYPNHKLSIVLSSGCSTTFPNHPQLLYQLAHEICHLLYPTGKADANLLNEGISTYFSKIYQELQYPNITYAYDCIIKSGYFRAYKLVENLLNSDINAIKKIRAKYPQISHITKEELLSFEFNLTDSEAEELTSKFNND